MAISRDLQAKFTNDKRKWTSRSLRNSVLTPHR